MNGGRRVLEPRPINGRRDRDEDLLLFREMHKREKERTVSLLQPVSDDFEPNSGSLSFYRMSSGKKGSGFEFLAETDKNDYDWLKTPPATPLFASLEMEANAPDLVVQREISITQPMSRFGGINNNNSSETTKTSNVERPKSANPKPKVPIKPVLIIPSHELKNTDRITPRPTTSEAKNTTKSAPATKQNATTIDNNTSQRATKTKPNNQRDTNLNFLSANLSKNLNNNGSAAEAKTNRPRSRGVSPQVRRSVATGHAVLLSDEMPSNLKTDRSASTTRGRPVTARDQCTTQHRQETKTPPQILVLSNETPPNLRTDRSLSATRGRPANTATQNKQETIITHLRTDRATSAARTRAAANTVVAASRDGCSKGLVGADAPTGQKQEGVVKPTRRQSCSPSVARGRKAAEEKPEGGGGGNGGVGHVFGSKMVDKLMSARKSVAVGHEMRTQGGNESSGFGRLMSRSSLDMAIKHMDIKKDRFNSWQLGGTVAGRKSISRD